MGRRTFRALAMRAGTARSSVASYRLGARLPNGYDPQVEEQDRQPEDGGDPQPDSHRSPVASPGVDAQQQQRHWLQRRRHTNDPRAGARRRGIDQDRHQQRLHVPPAGRAVQESPQQQRQHDPGPRMAERQDRRDHRGQQDRRPRDLHGPQRERRERNPGERKPRRVQIEVGWIGGGDVQRRAIQQALGGVEVGVNVVELPVGGDQDEVGRRVDAADEQADEDGQATARQRGRLEHGLTPAMPAAHGHAPSQSIVCPRMRRSSWPARSPQSRLRMAVVVGALATLIGLTSYALLTYALSRHVGVDVAAYWNAAERLRDGQPLYVAGPPNASDLYRYAPWFAVAWIPLTYLPHDAVVAAWVGLMIAAALASTVPLLWRGPTGLGRVRGLPADPAPGRSLRQCAAAAGADADVGRRAALRTVLDRGRGLAQGHAPGARARVRRAWRMAQGRLGSGVHRRARRTDAAV